MFEDKNYRADVGRSLIICTSNYESEREIHGALGDALSSRFDALIEFEQLSAKTRLDVLVQKGANVRRLGKITSQVISMMLVDASLLESSERGASG